VKELSIISGKGGTGKTTITAAFAALAENAVLADCDVDAADLHLLLGPKVEKVQDFHGLQLAVRDAGKCTECGLCVEKCLFDAIGDDLHIDGGRCEGCGVCELVCPEGAMELKDRVSGEAYLSSTRFGPMAHARLNAAEEASGKLVSLVRNNARELAERQGRDLIIIDGPPGIGCPVISASAGADMALLVSEPTVSGVHDLERVLATTDHFGVPALVCVNKADINPTRTEEIASFCAGRGIELVGRIPFDTVVTQAMVSGQPVTVFADGDVNRSLRELWVRVREVLLA